MSIIKMQQAVADTVLQRLLTIDPFAIVAGGAPRDWYLGKEATDLDVYFHPNPNWNVMTVRNQLIARGFEFTDVGDLQESWDDAEQSKSQYLANQYLKAVYNPINTAMKVQLMWMSEPTFESVLPQFTLNLSKVYYKNGKISTDTIFDLGVAEKALIRTNSVYINNNRYIDKIKAKFPDYTYYESEDAYFGNEEAPDEGSDDEEEFESWANTMRQRFPDPEELDGRDLVAF
jgi:hypothetical protein